jgi:hypothetical protein
MSDKPAQQFGLEQQIVSIHIPKTAGISLAQVYLARYGPENVTFFYDNRFFKKPQEGISENVVATAPPMPMIKERLIRSSVGAVVARLLSKYLINPPPALGEFPDDVAVIHGHFRIIPDIKNNYTLVTVLRDPLERLHSLFRYLMRRHHYDEPTPRWWHPHMSFLELVRLPQNQNTQWRYLEGLEVGDFTHIGVTEHLEAFIRQIDPEDSMGYVPRVNTTKQEPLELPRKALAEFQRLNYLDYMLYEQALERVIRELGKRTSSFTSYPTDV